MSRRLVVDAHNDLLVELWLRDHEANPFAGHWLEHLRAGGVGVQVCAISTHDRVFPGAVVNQMLSQVAAFHKAVRTNGGQVAMIRTAADIDDAIDSGRVGLLLSLEGVDGIASAEIGELLVDLGVRMVGLTWEQRNAAADGNGEPAHGGLSAFGRDLVRRFLERRVIMDVAHASARTFDDVIEMVGEHGGEVVCSHGGCAALRDLPRNVTDDQLRVLSAAGGVIGIPAVPSLLHPTDRSIDRVVDHVVHALEVAGEDHVGLGGDFMAQIMRAGLVAVPQSVVDRLPPGTELEVAIEGLEGPQDYDRLADALHGRGLSDTQVAGVLGDNMLRLLRRALS